MKATGVIRRVDDLGRIIIPKEIRRTMGVREGDPFEILVDKDTVMFKKYRPDILNKDDILPLLDDVREYYDGDKKEELIKHLETAYLILNQNS